MVSGGEQSILENFKKLTPDETSPDGELEFLITAESKLASSASKYVARLITVHPVSVALT